LIEHKIQICIQANRLGTSSSNFKLALLKLKFNSWISKMFELYLDTANVEHVARFNACLPLKGVTTNPSIVARYGIGLNQALSQIESIIGTGARFHAQVVSQSVDGMVEEAKRIHELPFDMVIKIPATEKGLTAIKLIKDQKITVLATAIYSAQQGFLAALCGADYLAPYINRIDTMGADGIGVVADLQLLIKQHHLNSKLLPASFKNTQQVMDALKLGVDAITLPYDVAVEMFAHPAVQPTIDKFNSDWREVFGDKLSFES
jgi:fructose-6-phosphate aldolase 1